MELAPDVWGVIYDYLANDYNFFRFISETNLLPKTKKINLGKLNWRKISEKKDLSYSFIDRYTNQLNWKIMTKARIKDWDFIHRYKNTKIHWDSINNLMMFDDKKIPYDFFNEFQNYLNWRKIAQWDGMCEDFVDEFHHRLDWGMLSTCQGLTEYILIKYKDKIKWRQVRYNQNIAIELINRYNDINKRI